MPLNPNVAKTTQSTENRGLQPLIEFFTREIRYGYNQSLSSSRYIQGDFREPERGTPRGANFA
jgi:hypothetical protein